MLLLMRAFLLFLLNCSLFPSCFIKWQSQGEDYKLLFFFAISKAGMCTSCISSLSVTEVIKYLGFLSTLSLLLCVPRFRLKI